MPVQLAFPGGMLTTTVEFVFPLDGSAARKSDSLGLEALQVELVQLWENAGILRPNIEAIMKMIANCFFMGGTTPLLAPKCFTTTHPGDCESNRNAIKNTGYVCFENSTQGTKAVHQSDFGRLLRLLQSPKGRVLEGPQKVGVRNAASY